MSRIVYMVWSDRGALSEGPVDKIVENFFVKNLEGLAGRVFTMTTLASDRIQRPGLAVPALYVLKLYDKDRASHRGFIKKFQKREEADKKNPRKVLEKGPEEKGNEPSLGPDFFDDFEQLATDKDWSRFPWNNTHVNGIDLKIAVKSAAEVWAKGERFFPEGSLASYLKEHGAAASAQFSVTPGPGDYRERFEDIVPVFVKHYYNLFDEPLTQAAKLFTFYSQKGRFQAFDGSQAVGQEAIKDKLMALAFQRIKAVKRIITLVDYHYQLLPDGIMVAVLGQFTIKTDDDKQRQQSYVENFILGATVVNFPVTNFVIINHVSRLIPALDWSAVEPAESEKASG